jgi:DNA-binding NarL/FixJ family response regulator
MEEEQQPALQRPAVAAVHVLLVDGYALNADLLAAYLAGVPHARFVGVVQSGEEALAAVSGRRPDLVLMDAGLPQFAAFEATARIKALPDPPHIVILTTCDSEACRLRADRAGADGCLVKGRLIDELPAWIRHVLAVARPGTPQ